VARRLTAIATLIATAVVLAGCGGGGDRANVTTGAVSTGAHAPSGSGSRPSKSRPLTRAQAIAFAHAVNLTSADLPGFTASSQREHTTPAGKRLEHEVLRCTGSSPSGGDQLVEVGSERFKLGHSPINFAVSSEVSVARGSSRTSRELTRVGGNRARACLSHYLNLLFREELLKELGHRAIARAISTSISISHGTPPSPGARGGFGWRIVATVTIHNVRLPFYFDILGFVYGPAEVSLESSGSLRPFPAKAQEHLYLLLLKRAETHGV
jgi:hypothetical protein